jgi:Uma2 family endonuclease
MIDLHDAGLHRWTVDEYERLVTSADLDRVELIDGVIYDVSPESTAHAAAMTAVYHRLLERFPDRWVLPAGSVRLDDGSLWNPDVYVLDVPPGGVTGTYPSADQLLLAVEVSLSTWHRDTALKLPVYARNGIPEVWVLRPVAGTEWELVRCTEPEAGGYRSMTTVPLPDGPGPLPA